MAPGRTALALVAAFAVGLPAGADEVPPEAVLADLPFEAGPPGRVIVDLAPADYHRSLRFMLDTGAADSVVTPRMARELGVRVRRLKSTPYQRPTRLGRDVRFWVDVSSSDTASKTGFEYGLLGGGFLAEYVLELDFGRRRLRFLDRHHYEVPERVTAPGQAVLPLRVVANRPVVEISLEGRPLRVLVDTGAPDTLILSGRAARRAELDWEPLARIEGGGVLGPIDFELAEVDSLALGPFRFGPGFPVLVAPHGLYNQGTSSDSVIGYDLLAQFTLRLDYPRQRLWLRREADRPLTLFSADYGAARRSGALLRPEDDTLQVLLVMPGSVAERRGLRDGDVVRGNGGGAPDPATFARALAGDGPLLVWRASGDGWEAVTLAAEAGAPDAVGAAPGD